MYNPPDCCCKPINVELYTTVVALSLHNKDVDTLAVICAILNVLLLKQSITGGYLILIHTLAVICAIL